MVKIIIVKLFISSSCAQWCAPNNNRTKNSTRHFHAYTPSRTGKNTEKCFALNQLKIYWMVVTTNEWVNKWINKWCMDLSHVQQNVHYFLFYFIFYFLFFYFFLQLRLETVLCQFCCDGSWILQVCCTEIVFHGKSETWTYMYRNPSGPTNLRQWEIFGSS